MRPGAQELASRFGLAGQSLRRYPDGSLPVYALGDRHVLKLYPAFRAEAALREAQVLRHLEGKLPVATPAVCAEGEYVNGWRYVMMTQLPGEGLAPAWPRVPAPDRDRLASEVGELLGALHAVDTQPLREMLGPPDWETFLAGQRATAVERQRACGLAAAWLEQIPEFLVSVPLDGPPDPAVLHTEVMREHLLIDPARWTLTGLFDFEPAMLGAPGYEFAAVALFVSCGDPRLLGRIMAAYGHDFPPRDLLAYTLLHAYSDLPWYFTRLPAPPQATLDSLAQAWFGTG